jgi:hypothetical protein
MEKMVTDPEIKKVIMVLDRLYAEKADGRKGGVGTETQIISPEIYAKADQNKFVGVASETGDDGRPFLPTFYKSRIYIDLSQADIYATNFEQLLRWIYDRPAHPKPALGKRPEFLDENAIQIPTRSRALRAIELLKSGSGLAGSAIEEYFSTFAASLEAFRIPTGKLVSEGFDDLIVQSIDSFLPYRDEFIGVISTVARYSRSNDDDRLLRRFFEQVVLYTLRPRSVSQWNRWFWDNFKFVVQEMFLYTIAFLLKHERFDLVFSLMSQGYYVGDAAEDARNPMQPFGIMRGHLESLSIRNQRLKLNRLSVHADMLEKRVHASGMSLSGLMQSDFILFMYDALSSHKERRRQLWWPDTLVYYQDYEAPFEIFARAESERYFKRICFLVAVSTKEELGDSFKLFGPQNMPLYLPSYHYRSLSLAAATNFEKLATRP